MKGNSKDWQMRVLVVEDDPDNALAMSLLLRQAGHEVQVAPDGETAYHFDPKALTPSPLVWPLLLSLTNV